MTLSIAITVKDSTATGRFLWNEKKQTFQIVLDFFDVGSFNPLTVFGQRFAEFVTPDSLINHLANQNIHIATDSLIDIFNFRNTLVEDIGSAELVGNCLGSSRRSLYIVTPNMTRVPLVPIVDHPDYNFFWGDTSAKTVETGKAIYGFFWNRARDVHAESFGLSLAYEFLSSAGSSFSLNAQSVCDWYVADTPLESCFSEIDRSNILRCGSIHSRSVG